MVFAGLVYWSVVWQAMNHGVGWLVYWPVAWQAYWSVVWQTMNRSVCWFGLLVCCMAGSDSSCLLVWPTGL